MPIHGTLRTTATWTFVMLALATWPIAISAAQTRSSGSTALGEYQRLERQLRAELARPSEGHVPSAAIAAINFCVASHSVNRQAGLDDVAAQWKQREDAILAQCGKPGDPVWQIVASHLSVRRCAGLRWNDAMPLLDALHTATASLPKEKTADAARLETLFPFALCGFHLAAGMTDTAEATRRRVLAERAVIELLELAEQQPRDGPTAPFLNLGKNLVEEQVWRRIRETVQREGHLRRDPPEAMIAELSRHYARFESNLEPVRTQTAWKRSADLWLAEFCWHLQASHEMAEPLERVRRVLGSPDFGLARESRYWNLLGLYQAARFEYELAYQSYQQALRIRQLPDVWSDPRERQLCEAESRNNLAEYYLRLGDAPRAAHELHAAYGIFTRLGCYQDTSLASSALTAPLHTLTNLADALKRDAELRPVTTIADYQKPIEYLNFALWFCQQPQMQATANHSALIALCLNSRGLLDYQLGEFTTARSRLLASRDAVRAAFPADHPRVAEAEVNLAWVAMSLGDLPEARRLFESAAAKFRKQPHAAQRRLPECLSYLARCAFVQGERQRTTDLLTEALDLQEKNLRHDLQAALSERERLALVQDARAHSEVIAWPGVLDTFLELAPQLGLSAELQYRPLLRWKGLLARHHLRALQSTDRNSHTLHDLVRRREQVLQQLRGLALSTTSTAQNVQLASTVSSLENAAHDLERQILQQQRPSSSFGEKISEQDVIAALPPRSVLVDLVALRTFSARKPGEIATQRRHYAAFVLRNDGRIERCDLGDAAVIDKQLDRFHRSLSDSRIDATGFSESGRFLVESFQKPLAKHLVDVETLIVAPDGNWHRLSMAAMPGQQQRFWLQELRFAVVPTAHSLVDRHVREVSKNRSCLAVGGIDFPQALAALHQSEAQARFVDQVLRQASTQLNEAGTLLGADATKSAVIDRLPRSRFAHIATHGQFVGELNGPKRLLDLSAQLDSAVVLAGMSKEDPLDANRLLTADELRGLHLTGLDLVVLSACQTGLGHVCDGQGLVGLIGALDQAGARSVVSALWEVSEDQTDLLMRRFYEHWTSPANPTVAEALRQAQLELLLEKKLSPYFWAAWTLNGDPQVRFRP